MIQALNTQSFVLFHVFFSIEVTKDTFLFLNWVSFNDPTRALNKIKIARQTPDKTPKKLIW